MEILKLSGNKVMEVIKDNWYDWEDVRTEARLRLQEDNLDKKAFLNFYKADAIHKAIEEIILEIENDERESL